MAIIKELLVRLGVDLRNYERDLKRAPRILEQAASRLRSAGIGATVLAAPIAAAGAASIKLAGDLDQGLTRSIAIMGDVSAQVRSEMEATARQVGLTGLGAANAAEAYYYLASAGLDARASIAALPVVADNAIAGQYDLATATDVLTDAQSALGLTIRDNATENLANLERVSDVIVKANELANASTLQFSESLTTKSGAALRALGKDVEEGVAVLAAFADQGVKGSEAGTQLAIVLRDLQTKAILNADEFARLGVHVFDARGEMLNLADVIGSLEGALAGLSDEEQKATLLTLGFSDKSIAALQALLGTSEGIRRYEAELRRAGGTTKRVADVQLSSFNNQMRQLFAEVQDVGIELGQSLIPLALDMAEVLRSGVDVLRDLVRGYQELPEWLQKTIASMGVLVVATGPLVLAGSLLLQSVTGLVTAGPALLGLLGKLAPVAGAGAVALSGLGLALSGIGLAIDGLEQENVNVWDHIKSFALASAEKIVDGVQLVFGRTSLQGLQNQIQTELAAVNETLRNAESEAAKSMARAGAEISEAQRQAFQDLLRQGLEQGLPHGPETAPKADEGFRKLQGLFEPSRKAAAGFERLRDAFTTPVIPPELHAGFGELLHEISATTSGVLGLAGSWAESSGAARESAKFNGQVSEIYQQLQSDLGVISALEEIHGESLETNTDRSNAYAEAIRSLVDLGIDPASAAIQELSQNLVDNSSAWEVWAADVIDVGTEAANVLFDAFQGLTIGIGQAVANAIVFEKNLGEELLQILKQIAAQIIAQLIALGIQALIQSIFRSTAAEVQASAEIAGQAGAAAAYAAADFIKDTGWLGIFGAAAIGAAAGLAVTGAAGGAIAAGHTVASGVSLAEGAVITGPTLALIGEGSEPEVVQPLSRLQQLLDDSRGGPGSIHVYLDGDELSGFLGARMVRRLKSQGVRP